MVCSGRVELLVADGRGESDNLNAVGELEVLFGDGSGSNTACTMSVNEFRQGNRYRLTDGLASTASTTSTAGLDAVLLQVSPVGVTGTRVQVHGAVAVVLGSLVLVHDAHANGGAQSDTKLGARLDLDLVLLIAWCCDGALSRSASGHLRLDVGLGELHARRDSVDDTSDTEAVRLAIAIEGALVGGIEVSRTRGGRARCYSEMRSEGRHDVCCCIKDWR